MGDGWSVVVAFEQEFLACRRTNGFGSGLTLINLFGRIMSEAAKQTLVILDLERPSDPEQVAVLHRLHGLAGEVAAAIRAGGIRERYAPAHARRPALRRAMSEVATRSALRTANARYDGSATTHCDVDPLRSKD